MLEAACYLCKTGPFIERELPWDEEAQEYCCPHCGRSKGLLVFDEV